MKWDGIPRHTNLGNRAPFLILHLSDRSAGEYARSTAERLLHLRPIKSRDSIPLET